MMTPEGKIKKKVKEVLKRYNCWTDWPVPSGYGKSTLDCIGCIGGYFFSIETKRPGGKPTTLQEACIARIQSAGGRAFVVDTADEKAECFKELIGFLEAFNMHPEE